MKCSGDGRTNNVELSGYALEPLREDEEFILYRGRPRRAEAPSVLLLATASTRPAPESLKKLEHEYSFRNELDPAWAVRPLSLSQHNDQKVLVLENPGGEPVNRLIQVQRLIVWRTVMASGRSGEFASRDGGASE